MPIEKEIHAVAQNILLDNYGNITLEDIIIEYELIFIPRILEIRGRCVSLILSKIPENIDKKAWVLYNLKVIGYFK